MKYNPKTDEYIGKAADFAKPILSHLRKLVHEAHPEITETIKWGMPCFEYKGILCSMASFKAHCSFGFWKASLFNDPTKLLTGMENAAMGHFGKIQSLSDLPEDNVIIDFIQQAVKLNADEVKVSTGKKDKKKELNVPAFILEALKTNPIAEETFHKFPYSHKKEYVEWVVEAKREETKAKRIQTMLEWLSEGKSRNWKYEK